MNTNRCGSAVEYRTLAPYLANRQYSWIGEITRNRNLVKANILQGAIPRR